MSCEVTVYKTMEKLLDFKYVINVCKCGHRKEDHVYIPEVKGYVIDYRFAGCHVPLPRQYFGKTLAFYHCENNCQGFET